MKLTVKDREGKDAGELEVGFALVEKEKGLQAVHDVVVAYNAAQRSGTACTKTIGEVATSGKKPWRQKGTGRARAGSFASPLWRGGGVVFGPKPRDFRKKVSKSTRDLALRKALSERLSAGDVLVVSDLDLPEAKTKEILAVLDKLSVDGTTLIVTDTVDPKLTRSARNVPHIDLTTAESLNTYEVLRNDRLVFTRSAWGKVEERVARRDKEASASEA